MKKKIFLTLVMAVVFALTLVFMVSAESVHSGKVDLNATVTLSDGTVCSLFDSEGNALIWYNDASGELQSIRADDSRVKYKATYKFNVGNSTVGSVAAYEVSDMWIQLDSGKIDRGNIVVLNLMDDDVLINEATNSSYIGNPVNCVKTIQWANKVLEYAYLRLDTVAIQQQTFNGCPKLKYINLEDLTELRAIGGSQTFAQTPGQTVLFAGEVLDLTKTKLVGLSGDGSFSYVPLAGIKLPSTITNINPWCLQGTALVSYAFPMNVATVAGSQFNDCKSLKEIYINNVTTEIADRAFNNTALEKIYFVGTLDELNALLDNTGANNNAPFWTVVGENRANVISYTDYLKLADKSGKYVVYNYSYCEAYDGDHDIKGNNPCVGTCSICQIEVINHSANADVTVSYVYTSFAQNGQKITSCANDGCTYEESEVLEALFTCTGFSASQTGTNGIVLGFNVNHEAIDAYTSATGNTIEYGVFAGSPLNLGNNDLSDEGLSEKVIKAEITKTEFAVFEIKIMGFATDVQKETAFAIGAYVAETNSDDVTTYSYMQLGTPTDGERYCYNTYNNIVSALN